MNLPDKILILDIDGVLNDCSTIESNGASAMNTGFVCNLDRIIKETNCGIVVSSSWRIGGLDIGSDFYQGLLQACISKDQFQRIMGAIVGQTPILNDGNRGDEIGAWIDDASFTGIFVIVDDDTDMGPFISRLVRTSFSGPKGTTGLTSEHTERIISMLNDG